MKRSLLNKPLTSGTPTNTSGGLVHSHNTSTGLRYTLGIHKGTKGGVAKYVKANQINRSLGTSRY